MAFGKRFCLWCAFSDYQHCVLLVVLLCVCHVELHDFVAVCWLTIPVGSPACAVCSLRRRCCSKGQWRELLPRQWRELLPRSVAGVFSCIPCWTWVACREMSWCVPIVAGTKWARRLHDFIQQVRLLIMINAYLFSQASFFDKQNRCSFF